MGSALGLAKERDTVTVAGTQVDTTAVTTEETLWTQTLTPAQHKMNSDGSGLVITAWGKFGSNTNSKTIRIYIGATVVASIAVTSNGLGWHATTKMYRIDAATTKSRTLIFVGGGVQYNGEQAAPSPDWAGDVTLKITAQNGTASAGDTSLLLAAVGRL